MRALYNLEGNFQPESMIDLGCGTGKLTLAATMQFPSIRQAIMLDAIASTLELAKNAVRSAFPSKVLYQTNQVDLLSPHCLPGQCDLVVQNPDWEKTQPDQLLALVGLQDRLIAPGGRAVLLVSDTEAAKCIALVSRYHQRDPSVYYDSL